MAVKRDDELGIGIYSWQTVQTTFKDHILPIWGDIPVTELTRGAVLSELETWVRKPDKKSSHIKNSAKFLRKFYNWLLDRELADSNPFLRMTLPIPQAKQFSGHWPDARIKALWLACEEVGYPCGSLTQILLLTGARRDEFAESRFSEYDFPAALFRTIRHKRNYMKKTEDVFVLPLSTHVLKIIDRMPRWPGEDFFLISHNEGKTPMSSMHRRQCAKRD